MSNKKGYYASPRWTGEILDCSMPVTFDTYSNCAFNCVYCFAYFQRALGAAGGDYKNKQFRSVNVERVRRMFIDPDKYAGSFAWYIKQRRTMQWGGMSDGFDWHEKEARVSLQLLRFFREIEYPLSISTKGAWFTDDPEYREVLRGAKHIHFKMTIVTADEAKATNLERGVESPAKRFEALCKLRELEVGPTTMRFRPFIIGVSDQSQEQIVKWAKKAGCYSLTTEFLCLETRSKNVAKDRYNAISESCGFNIFEFYKRHSARRSGLLRLNYEFKRPYVERLQALCENAGLAFYVSDAHHKEKSCGTCCCGIPDTGQTSNVFRGHYAEALQIAKRNGWVSWPDIETECACLKNVRYNAAPGFNVGTTKSRAQHCYQTMYDYLRNGWNNFQAWTSPARYFAGVMIPAGTDVAGDVFYVYNGSGKKIDAQTITTQLTNDSESFREFCARNQTSRKT